MTPASISIAMATYNGARFLRAQLDSIAAQSHFPAELVISDDNSIDETRQIVADFAASAPFPVHFHANPVRLGYRGNFLRAATLCSGNLIAFCDQDDIWHANKLATMAALFGNDPDILLVHHNANILTTAGEISGPLIPPGRHPPCYEPLTAPPWLISHGFTQIFRRELLAFQIYWAGSLDANDQVEEPMTHDQWYLFLASVFGRILWIKSPLADYRQHSFNTLGAFREDFTNRLRLWLADRSGVYRQCVMAAERRVKILDAICQDLSSPGWRERAATSSVRYQALSALYEKRARLYQLPGLLSRLSAFRALCAANAYNARGDWTFNSTKGACKDFILGVFLIPVLRRYGFPAKGGDPTCASVAH